MVVYVLDDIVDAFGTPCSMRLFPVPPPSAGSTEGLRRIFDTLPETLQQARRELISRVHRVAAAAT